MSGTAGVWEFQSTARSKCVREPESTHVPNGCALVLVCLYVPCLYTVCVPVQSIHGLLWCGYLCDVDVPVAQVLLYVSVPEWVQGPLAILLTRGSVSSSLGSRGRGQYIGGGGERNTEAMALDTGILNLVRAVRSPPYSSSSPNTNTHSLPVLCANNPEGTVSW